MTQLTTQKNPTEFLIYASEDGDIKVDVFLQDENIWLPQKKIAELFGVEKAAISKHLKNIYEEQELKKEATISILETVQQEWNREVKRNIEYYNLDTIIAVWYRINSKQATQFRIWANKVLKEFIIKGYTMDVDRLKNPHPQFWKDYFDEQVEKIRDIRSSERRFYQKITDIYAQCSIDYDPKSTETKEFFATIQNKLHFSITGKTAAEIIHTRVDHTKNHMGLTTWKNAPHGPIRKPDVSIAKNYLNETEMDGLNRIVSMYLDYAEDRAKRNITMNMSDWIEKLNAFLQFNERDILTWHGKITSEIAKTLAIDEFEKYRAIQDRVYESDFDRVVKQLDIS